MTRVINVPSLLTTIPPLSRFPLKKHKISVQGFFNKYCTFEPLHTSVPHSFLSMEVNHLHQPPTTSLLLLRWPHNIFFSSHNPHSKTLFLSSVPFSLFLPSLFFLEKKALMKFLRRLRTEKILLLASCVGIRTKHM